MAGTPQYGVHRDAANTEVSLNYAGTKRVKVNSSGVELVGTVTLPAGSIERADLATETVFIEYSGRKLFQVRESGRQKPRRNLFSANLDQQRISRDNFSISAVHFCSFRRGNPSSSRCR